MEPLAFDADGYQGTYKLIAGRSCLDLVNTISWPDTERAHDWLAKPANVPLWLEAVGLEPTTAEESDIDLIARIRGVLADLLRPLAHGGRPDVESVERFNMRLSEALGRKRIDSEKLSWSWAPPRRVGEAFDPVIVDAAELIAHGDRDRLKRCPECRWLFEDQTRNGRRRWCDMADCGSRAKSRSYYARHKK